MSSKIPSPPLPTLKWGLGGGESWLHPFWSLRWTACRWPPLGWPRLPTRCSISASCHDSAFPLHHPSQNRAAFPRASHQNHQPKAMNGYFGVGMLLIWRVKERSTSEGERWQWPPAGAHKLLCSWWGQPGSGWPHGSQLDTPAWQQPYGTAFSGEIHVNCQETYGSRWKKLLTSLFNSLP